MLELGRYAVPVLVAWGTGLGLLAALVVQTLLAARAARRALEAEEAALPPAARRPAPPARAPAAPGEAG